MEVLNIDLPCEKQAGLAVANRANFFATVTQKSEVAGHSMAPKWTWNSWPGARFSKLPKGRVSGEWLQVHMQWKQDYYY